MARRKSLGDPQDRERFVARLRKVVQGFGSANSLAVAAGISEGALRKWMQGASEPTRDRLVAIARTAGINLTWLATGAGPKERSGMEDTPLLEGFVALEELSEARGTGPLSATEIAFSQAWVARHAAESAAELAGLPMPDDSMAPLLPEGAALVVDRGSATVSRDGVHVLRLDGVLTVRRLQRLPGGELEATPANPAYQSFRIQRDAPGVSVIGRVIWAGHDF